MAKGLQGWFESAFGKKNRDTAKLKPLVERIKADRGRYQSSRRVSDVRRSWRC